MSRFIESMRVQHGKLHQVHYHNARANRTRAEFYPGLPELDFNKEVHVPSGLGMGVYKCRVTYDENITQIHFEKYDRAAFRTLRCVVDDQIEYRYKFSDRSEINAAFAQREGCDDVLIIRNGLVTDTSYANIAFLDGDRWVTPQIPLLAGTKRQELIETGVLEMREIRVGQIARYTHWLPLNALLGFYPSYARPVSRIY